MDREKARLAADKLFRDMAGAMSAGMVYVGTRTGLFRAMQGKGPMGLGEVVRASGLQPRYVEEWLKGMACAGYLAYDPAAATYTLSDEHAYFLASEGTDHFAGGMFEMVPVLMRAAPRVAQAFRAGGGVPFEEFGPDCVTALDLINRGMYEHRFTDYWLKALPEVIAKLQAGGRMLDVGCGSGRVCVAFAKAFPKARHRRHRSRCGIHPRAPRKQRASCRFSSKPRPRQLQARARGFDLITLCDCIHDLAAPGEDAEGGARAAEAGRHAVHRRAEGGRSARGQPRSRSRRCSTASASSTA